MIIIILIILITLTILSIYMLIRNQKVFNFRQQLIKEDLDLFNQFPSYEKMLYSFKPLTKDSWLPRK